MQVIRDIPTMRARSAALRGAGQSIGFVPTMGYLHEGHLALVRLAREQAAVVVVSNFVNPIQFGPKEDFARYPRDLERDNQLCAREGVDIVFCPAAEDMYVADASVSVDENKLTGALCGPLRPGHFRGVLTVVAKLFNIVAPDIAVFGQKDAQQVRIIRRMVRDLDFPIRILEHPTVREPDGLAMSSRNVYLSAAERTRAVCISRGLRAAERAFADGERDGAVLERVVRSALDDAHPDQVDYVSVVDDETLDPVSRICRPALLAVAVRIGTTRLIDNVRLMSIGP